MARKRLSQALLALLIGVVPGQLEAAVDLTITILSVTPNPVNAGSSVSIQYRVTNSGTTGASNFATKFYLSPNTTASGTYLSPSDPISYLGGGNSATATISRTIPSGTAGGGYYIVGWVDAFLVVAESNDDNNTGYKSITVAGSPQSSTTTYRSSSTTTYRSSTTTYRSSTTTSVAPVTTTYRSSTTTTSVQGGTRYFLRDATENTITNILYPWTQYDSCYVCWTAAGCTVFAYWDDYPHNSSGPWEGLFEGGNGTSYSAYQLCVQNLFTLAQSNYGITCGDGANDSQLSGSMEAYSNGTVYPGKGYDFSYTVTPWPFVFFSAIVGSIDADEPKLLKMDHPNYSSTHWVLIVGYDDGTDALYIYDNHDFMVKEISWDDVGFPSTTATYPGGAVFSTTSTARSSTTTTIPPLTTTYRSSTTTTIPPQTTTYRSSTTTTIPPQTTTYRSSTTTTIPPQTTTYRSSTTTTIPPQTTTYRSSTTTTIPPQTTTYRSSTTTTIPPQTTTYRSSTTSTIAPLTTTYRSSTTTTIPPQTTTYRSSTTTTVPPQTTTYRSSTTTTIPPQTTTYRSSTTTTIPPQTTTYRSSTTTTIPPKTTTYLSSTTTTIPPQTTTYRSSTTTTIPPQTTTYRSSTTTTTGGPGVTTTYQSSTTSTISPQTTTYRSSTTTTVPPNSTTTTSVGPGTTTSTVPTTTTTIPGCIDDPYEYQGSDLSDDSCFGAKIEIGETQTHSHCDVDWVYFEALAGATYRIETSNLVGGADTILAVAKECGDELAFNDDFNGLASRIDFVAPSSGFFDVRVGEYGESYLEGEGYDIVISCVADCGDVIFSDGFESGHATAWSMVVLPVVASGSRTLFDLDSFDFVSGIVGNVRGGDLYILMSNASCGGGPAAWANNPPQSGGQHLSDEAGELSAFSAPGSSYNNQGVCLHEGGVYVYLRNGPPGEYVLFRMIDVGPESVTLEYQVR